MQNPRHWFECDIPRISEPLVWRKHPVLAIECSQYGNLRPSPGGEEIVFLSRTKTCTGPDIICYKALPLTTIPRYLGSRTKIIKECWEGKVFKSGIIFYFKNFNSLDARPDNIISSAELDLEKKRRLYLRDQKEFINETIEQMIKRQKKVSPDLDLVRYWMLLGIPFLFIKHWKKRMEQKEPVSV